MLDFLVTSKARRRLLQLLWGAGKTGSASQFSRFARVGFASAYRELRAMQSLGLVLSEREGGAEVYRANDSHPLADALRTLVTAPRTFTDDNERRLRAQLKALGAPLQAEPDDSPHEAPTETLEETLVRGVKLAHRDPAVARSLPTCLYRQRNALDAEKLRHHALQLSEKRALGFFLDLTSELSGDPSFTKWTEALHDRRWKAPLDFFPSVSPSYSHRRDPDVTTPPVARKWGFRMNMGLDAFRSIYDKFAAIA